MSGTVGFGKKYLDHFQELKTRVVTEIHDIHHGNFELDGMHKSVIVNSKYFDVNLNELDQILLDDVEEYLFSLSEVQQDVAQSRWGFHHEVETLEDIGRRSAVVRERIRQLSSVINKNVPHYIRIHPKVLGQNIRENLASNLAEVFPNLRDCFDSNYHFYSFLEILCMEESGAIHDIQEPDVDLNLLDLFFCDNSSPISYEVVVAELASNFGYSKALAANTIRELINKSKLKSDPEGLKPINLGRKEAVAHALLGYENGLPWKDIAKIVNRLEISNVCINEDRMQNSIFSDSDFIYQCDRGAYKNIKYFKIENVDVPHIIKSILDYIKVSNQKSIHLNDYYHQADGSIKAVNYYDIRHIARTFGSDYGLFFYGKSGVDSVGLTTDFEPVTQQKLILDLMNKAKAGLTNAEIANRLKSKSLAHAAFYLDKMMEAGEVVRVDNMIYTTPEKAFINIDVDSVLLLMEDILIEEGRPVEVDIFRIKVNRELGLSYSKYFYLALASHNLIVFGWHKVYNLISRTPIEFSSLNDVLSTLCESSLNTSQNIEIIQKNICITREVASKAIHYWDTSSADK